MNNLKTKEIIIKANLIVDGDSIQKILNTNHKSKARQISRKTFVGVKDIVASGLCCRNTLFDLMREDPTFPKGKKVGGKENSPLKWWLNDIVTWLKV